MDFSRKAILSTGAAGLLILLAGCGAEPAPTPTATTSSAAPSPSPTPDPSASAAAAAEADAALLLVAPENLKTWSEQSLPEVGEDGTLATFYGWLSRNTQRTTTAEFGPAPAGEYLVTIACAGDPVAVDITSSDGIPAASASCTSGSVAIGATTTSTGLRATFTLDDDAAPTNYAIAFQTAPPTD